MTRGARIRPVTTRVDAALCARAATDIGDVVNRLETMRGASASSAAGWR